jgi:hypothetical protein
MIPLQRWLANLRCSTLIVKHNLSPTGEIIHGITTEDDFCRYWFADLPEHAVLSIYVIFTAAQTKKPAIHLKLIMG